MVKYTCEVCEKVFTQKGHYTSHKNRKRPCQKDLTVEKKVESLVNQRIQEVLAKSVDAPRMITEPIIIKPFLKWVGGKTQILEKVLELFPNELENYHEPFVGGGSVLLGFLSYVKAGKIKVHGKIYASDINSNTIGLYQNIQKYPDIFCDELQKFVDEFSKVKGAVVNRKAETLEEARTSQESYYFWIRSKFNSLSKEERITPIGSAMLLFLNKTCFRGVYREGPKGFNVPFGNYKNPSIFDREHIKSVSELLKDVVFSTCSFEESMVRGVKGDFMYLDPPYAPETKTSFVSYTADGFDLDKHKKLFTMCNDLKSQDIRMLMSNADVSLVKEAFPSPIYTIKIISCRRAIHSKEPDSITNEVLIMN